MRKLLPILMLLSVTASAQQVASDNFNRANGGLGTNWTTIDHAPQIISNQWAGVGTCASPSQCDAFWNANSFNNNQYAQITTVAVSSTNVSAVVRASASNGYYALYNGVTLAIFKNVAGTFTSLASNSTSFASTDVMLFSAVGTTLTVCKNGSSVLTVTDSTFASGHAGASAGADTGSLLDNWAGGNMSVAGCTIPSSSSAHAPPMMSKLIDLRTPISWGN